MEHQPQSVYSQHLTFDQIKLFPFKNQSSISSISLQKTWFQIELIFIKILFIGTNIAESQSLTDEIIIILNDEIFYLIWIWGTTILRYWWQSVLLVCKSIVIEPFSRLTLRSKNAALFFDDSYANWRLSKNLLSPFINFFK